MFCNLECCYSVRQNRKFLSNCSQSMFQIKMVFCGGLINAVYSSSCSRRQRWPFISLQCYIYSHIKGNNNSPPAESEKYGNKEMLSPYIYKCLYRYRYVYISIYVYICMYVYTYIQYLKNLRGSTFILKCIYKKCIRKSRMLTPQQVVLFTQHRGWVPLG